MIQKEIVSKKIQELKNFVVGAKSLLSTARTREEMENQLQRIESKIQEIEVLINRENQSWN
jgi:hypothetical protein